MLVTLKVPFDPTPGAMVFDHLARNVGLVVSSTKAVTEPVWIVDCEVEEGTEGHQVMEPALGDRLNG